MTSFAGNSTGISVLPNVDEQVLVISLDIQKSKLVAIGSIWSEAAQPPETGENGDADLNQDGKNSLTFIKTKSENMLIFDDTDGKEKIQIIDSKTNSRIEFIAEDKKLSISTDEEIDMTSVGKYNVEVLFREGVNVKTSTYQIEVASSIFEDMYLKPTGTS